MDTKTAVAYCIGFLSQSMDKSKEDVVMMLLMEALVARGLMTPNKEEKK
jgi:hypothetical protein